MMDEQIAAAARALTAGDPISALGRVALRDDPPALALRGIAMAQLGDYPCARKLLRQASQRFGPRDPIARARCDVAIAEVALAMRDVAGSPRALENAAVTLEAHADHVNATQARLIAARRLLLLGRMDAASTALAQVETHGLPASLAAVTELTIAELKLRSLQVASAHAALTRAQVAAECSGIESLRAEVEEGYAVMTRPAARRLSKGKEQVLRLEEIEALLASGDLVVDACRRGLRSGSQWLSLARRPIPFLLLRTLAESFPQDVAREALIAKVFNTRYSDESHRARLRVEMGRLRRLVGAQATIESTVRGFIIVPTRARSVVVLVPPIDGARATLLALLSDGKAWSTAALALALGSSQRTVQRALVELESSGKVRSVGRTRARRWLSPPLTKFTTILLLPGALALG